MRIYLLYGGDSVDGRGVGVFMKATEDIREALTHYKKVKDDPYSTGCVKVLTETTFRRVFSTQDEVKFFGKEIK